MSHPRPTVHAEHDEAEPAQKGRTGDSGGGTQRQRPPSLAPAVDRADDLGTGKKHRAHTQRDSQQRDGLVERSQPQHRNDSGGPEELPVEQPEHDRGQPGPDDEWPDLVEPGKRAGSAGTHQESENDEQGTVSGIPEHHSEHQHVRDAGEHAGVDVGVRHGPIRLDQRRERLPQALSGVQQRRGIHPTR